jgi:TonB family protein
MRAWHINSRFLRRPKSNEPFPPGPTVVLVSSIKSGPSECTISDGSSSKQPFADTFDPEHFFLSSSHREAITALIDAVECNLGLSAFIAEAGAGKTTLLHRLLECYSTAAYTIFLPRSCGSADGLKVTLLSELQRMLENGGGADRRVLIVLDEAHTLTTSELEVIKMLATHKSEASKLLHFMLVGRPELSSMLSRPPLVDLKRRITVINRELCFKPVETRRYIDHQLKVVRQSEPPIFSSDAISEIAAASQGIPRRINFICSSAMAKARELCAKEVTGSIIRDVKTGRDFQLLFSLGSQIGGSNAEENNPLREPPSQLEPAKRSGGPDTSRLPLLRQIRLPQIIHDSYKAGLAAALGCVAVALFYFAFLCGLTLGVNPHRRAELLLQTQRNRRTDHQNMASLSSASSATTEAAESVIVRNRLNSTETSDKGHAIGSSYDAEIPIDQLTDQPVDSSPADSSVDDIATGSEAPPPLPASAESSLRMPSLNVAGLDTRAPTPVTVGLLNMSEATSPQVVKMVRPSYPSKARKQKIYGEVVVTGVVGSDGRLKMISTSGPAVLEEAAVKAAQEWRYKPPTLNGDPIDATARIVFNFSQPD